MQKSRADVAIVGAGHNGLVAACLLALDGKRVIVLESKDVVGGAAISTRVFPGIDARLSKYSYLVSLLPRFLADELGIQVPLARRRVSSYTPDPADPSRGLAVPVDDPAVFDTQMQRLTGSTRDADAWREFYDRTTTVARRIFPTLTEPLLSRARFRELVSEQDWRDFFERPIGEVIEQSFANDVVRGIVLTDALIGTFASAHDPSLHQNICFLYHVIGNGTGDWDVPIGGMGAITDALANRARELGVEIRLATPVTSVDADAMGAVVRGDDFEIACDHVLANCAPQVLDRLMGRTPAPIDDLAGGAQVKVNMLLSRLPKLRDASVDPRDAFSGTFHINESYLQLERAFQSAASGALPDPLPAEIYCHSLSDPSILGPGLQASGAQTLTVFALHAPHRLFVGDNDAMRERAKQAVLSSVNSVLAEPIEGCLFVDADGDPCLDVNTTVDLENDLGLPAGNIFHTPLDWPFALDDSEIGSWGNETDVPSVRLCGSGARRGGGVSGIPGFTAARSVR